MKLASIRLFNYFLTELHVQARPNFKSTEPADWKDNAFKVDTSARQLEPDGDNPPKWQVELAIVHQPAPEDNFPYSFRLKLVAFYEETPTLRALQDELRERTVRINGTSMLYGAAREIVRAATGRGPHSSVLLPTVSFYDPKPATPSENAAPKAADLPPKKAIRKKLRSKKGSGSETNFNN